MGYIKEPAGIDLVVGPSELTEQDTACIRKAIAAYKKNKAKSTRNKIVPYQGEPYVQGIFISQPQTLSLKASDGKLHLIKITPAAQSAAKPEPYRAKKSRN